MSTISKLRKVVAAYLQVPVGDLEVEIDELTHEKIDLLMNAANNAKRFAQNRFDWESELELVYVDTTTTGSGVWSSAKRYSDNADVKVKQPQTFYWEEESGGKTYFVPLYHHSKKHGAVQWKERLETQALFDRRYLSDRDRGMYTIQQGYNCGYEVYILGNRFEIQPLLTESKRIYLDAFLWFLDYTDDADTDTLFLEKGFEYMQWYCVVELNNRFQTFIPQQEGNLPPPVKARDQALEALVEYNNFIVESGRQPK